MAHYKIKVFTTTGNFVTEAFLASYPTIEEVADLVGLEEDEITSFFC